MKCIFVDNFRGFKETIVPLKDVNFLVGENSTGKSSLLGLIKLINSPRFWMRSGGEFDCKSSGKMGHLRDKG